MMPICEKPMQICSDDPRLPGSSLAAIMNLQITYTVSGVGLVIFY